MQWNAYFFHLIVCIFVISEYYANINTENVPLLYDMHKPMVDQQVENWDSKDVYFQQIVKHKPGYNPPPSSKNF